MPIVAKRSPISATAELLLLWPKGWMHQDAIGMETVLSPGDFVLDGTQPPPQKKRAEPPIFGARLLWPNGCMDQDANWYGVGLDLRDIVLDGANSSSNFRPMSVVAKRLDGLRCHLVWR